MVNDVVNSEKKKSRDFSFKFLYIYLLAFIIPFIIMCMAFAFVKIYPFGDQQVLTIDAWHQYYPFLSELRRKVAGGESLFYCWRMGLGSGFTAIISYYLASPLNIIFILCPEAFLKEAFTLMILIKIGFAGSFSAFSLNRIHKSNRFEVLIFSTFYALCGWVLGYYWNIMWLDTFAVFPLVVLGIISLIKYKKYKLYTVSLSLAICTNYYIGFMVCVFTAIYFFAQCIILKNTLKELWNNLKNIIIFSAVSILMSTSVILPSIVALQFSYKQKSTPTWHSIGDWLAILANSFAFVEPTFREGMPNVYCGLICVVLVFVFCCLIKISKREKIVTVLLLLFFYASMNINMLNYAWHGFHNTNQLPFRFTFIFCFFVVMIAYRAFIELTTSTTNSVFGKFGIWYVGLASIVYFLFPALQKIGDYSSDSTVPADYDKLWRFLIINLLIIILYFSILFLVVKNKISKKIFTFFIAVIVGLELIPTVIKAPKIVGTTERNSFPDKYNEVQQVLKNINDKEEEEFYRMEFTSRYSRNTPVLYGYNGITAFATTVNESVREFMGNMGLPAHKQGLWYHYQNSTPVNNAFLNLRYIISRGSKVINKEYLTEDESAGNVCAYKNETYLPIGFMVENSLADFRFDGTTPFEKQNNLLKAAAGISEDVFKPLDIVHVGHENVDVERTGYGKYHYKQSDDANPSENEKFKYNYEMPENGCVYAYMNMNLNENNDVSVGIDDNTNSYEIRDACIFPAGTYEKGEVFSIKSELEAGKTGDLEVYVGLFDQGVFNKAYDMLKDEVLDVTEYTSKSIKGKIAAKKDGLMYTSIPYEPGWKAYVDGKESDIKLIDDAFMSVVLPEGEHEVEFLYSPVHVYVAIFLSVSGIGLFIGICIMDKKKKLFFIRNATRQSEIARNVQPNKKMRKRKK